MEGIAQTNGTIIRNSHRGRTWAKDKEERSKEEAGEGLSRRSEVGCRSRTVEVKRRGFRKWGVGQPRKESMVCFGLHLTTKGSEGLVAMRWWIRSQVKRLGSK